MAEQEDNVKAVIQIVIKDDDFELISDLEYAETFLWFDIVKKSILDSILTKETDD